MSNLKISAILYKNPTGYNPALEGRSRIADHEELILPTSTKIGGLTGSQPVAGLPVALGGLRAHSYYLDFYDRVHVSPAKVNIGNLLTAQQKYIEVWNARFVSNELQVLVAEDTFGIELTGQPPEPLGYAPLQSRLYTLIVPLEGPPVVDARFLFTFEHDAYPELSIFGRRLITWWPRANWVSPITERWEWYTDVMVSKNKKEQRVKVRGAPRRSMEYTLLAKNNNERRKIENMLFAWQHRPFGLPLWFDQEYLSEVLLAGGNTIPCTTATRSYYVGGLVGLFVDDLFEVVTITEVASDHVKISSPTLNQWPVGAKVVPVVTAKIAAKSTIRRETDEHATMIVQFRIVEPDRTIPLVEGDVYKGYDVLLAKPDWSRDITTTYTRNMRSLDFSSGPTVDEDLDEVSTQAHQYHWLASGRDEVYALKQFFFARFGKLVPIWVPTYSDDLTVTGAVPPSGGSVIVDGSTGFVSMLGVSVQRRDLRIEMNNGSIYYARVTSAVSVGGNDILAIDAVIPVELNPETVRKISYMTLCRLDADSVEAVWETDSVLLASTVFVSVRDDV